MCNFWKRLPTQGLREYLALKGSSYSSDDGFKFKLARYCDIEPLVDLRGAIIYTVNNEGTYLQAS